MPATSKESYCARLHTGSRTYFFDVKTGLSNAVRLEITESRRRGEGFERSRVTVFEEDAARFVDELLKAVSHMSGAHSLAAVRPQPELQNQESPRFQQIRSEHPNAYTKWTPEEDQQLVNEIQAHKPIAEIARTHSRQPSAIRSRIEKLNESQL